MIVEMILVVASGHRKGEGSVPGQVGIFFSGSFPTAQVVYSTSRIIPTFKII